MQPITQSPLLPVTPAAPTPQRMPRPVLQRSIMRWMMIVAGMSVLICLVIFNYFVRAHLIERLRKEGDLLAQVVAASVSGRGSLTSQKSDSSLFDSLRRHPRVAFLSITTPEGRRLYSHVYNNEAWTTFLKAQRNSKGGGHLDITKAATANLSSELVVCAAEIQSSRHSLIDTRPDQPPLPIRGIVLLGLQSDSTRQLLWQVQIAQLIAVGIVCVACLPIIHWRMRTWTKSLRELLEATQHLAAGHPPQPVTLGKQDELGYLAGAFNDMAGKLMAGRKQLLEANEQLEQRVRDRTRELREAVNKLDQMASTDSLTGLANRRAFTEALNRYFDESICDEQDLVCMMIDLDGFKPINDTLGHDAGDELLKVCARVLTENCRTSDVVARLGGDEFVILMANIQEGKAREIGDRILQHFVQESRELLGDIPVAAQVSLSVGLALRMHSQCESASELLSQADKALYSAKDSGKDCMRVYGEAKAA